MGLGIGLGIVCHVAGDDEGVAHGRRQLVALQQALADEGIEGWVEAERLDLPNAGMRRHVGSFPYSFLHYLRRVYALHSAGRPIEPALDEAALARDEPLVADETTLLSSHLLCHSDCEGYYVPVDFMEPCFLPPERQVAGGGMVGSSDALLRELVAIAPALGIALDADDRLSDAEAARLFAVDETSPWYREHVVWLALHEACVASVRHRLTVVFC
jgi:hypothetical protein